MSLDTFTRAYIDAALWSSCIGTGRDEPEDTSLQSANFDQSDIAPPTMATIRAECEAFYSAHSATWDDHWSDDQAGHDYWLTRNHHGAGFWDRYACGDGHAIGERLTEAAHADGSRDWYIGDDEMIYQA